MTQSASWMRRMISAVRPGEVVVKYYFQESARSWSLAQPFIPVKSTTTVFLKHTITLSKNSGKYYKNSLL